MGVQKRYNEAIGKWELIGWGFRWTYDTESKADQARNDAWEQHKANINAFRFVSNTLLSYR